MLYPDFHKVYALPSLLVFYYFKVSLCLYNVSIFVHESFLLTTPPPLSLSGARAQVQLNPQYQNMKKMLTTKNATIAELRTKLSQYERQ